HPYRARRPRVLPSASSPRAGRESRSPVRSPAAAPCSDSTPPTSRDGRRPSSAQAPRDLPCRWEVAGCPASDSRTTERYPLPRCHPSQRHRIPCNLQLAQEVERRRLAAADIERNNPAGKIALRLENAGLLRILKERRIVNLLDLWIPRQHLGNALRALALPVH